MEGDQSLKWTAVKEPVGGSVAEPQTSREFLVVLNYQYSQIQTAIEELKNNQKEFQRDVLNVQRTLSDTLPQFQSISSALQAITNRIKDDEDCLEELEVEFKEYRRDTDSKIEKIKCEADTKIEEIKTNSNKEINDLKTNLATVNTYFKIMGALVVLIPTIISALAIFV